MSIIQIIIKYQEAFLNGLLITVRLAMTVWIVGILLGTAIGVLAAKYKKAVGLPFISLSFFLTSIPILVFLFWFHYPLQALLKITIDPFISAAVVISLINIFSVAQIIRTNILDFPKQYEYAAKVCGLSLKVVFFKIKLPLISRQIIPSILPIQITMLHTTLFASLISVEEIFRVSQRVNSIIYQPIEIYTALALFFLIICLPVNLLAHWLRIRYTRNISEN